MDYKKYVDKYFLRSKEILQKDKLNPIVKLQVFIRKGGVLVYGLKEAIDFIKKHAPSAEICALDEGTFIEPCETVMTIEAPIQDIIDLETIYLGIISCKTTLMNDNKDIDLKEIRATMTAITALAGDRPVMYMGARHWHYNMDGEISKACFDGGASACSTDAGAATVGKEGAGTIPHALEAVYHWSLTKAKDIPEPLSFAVATATIAFDRHINKSVPRIALIDYANREILDSLQCCRHIKDLWGVRVDTCGENFMQGIMPKTTKGTSNSKGVSVKGVYLLRKMLNDSGFQNIKIVLSSGFANPDKVRNFVEAEKELGIKLFDMLGVGQVFHSIVSTGDIVEVDGIEIHKVGRPYRPNKRLKKI